jgi:hypothetical protein
MSQGTDVIALLGWGIRKYAWLIALFVIALGIVIPGLLERAPDRYQASAQVGPIQVLRVPNVDILPRMATDVFGNVPDDPAVKGAAGVSDSQQLGAEQLELVAAQDNIIFTVVARSTSPEVARDVANVAAARFVDEMNVYSQPVGSFSVNRLATAPTEPMPRLAGPMAWGISLAAGLLVGLAAMVLLLMLRRPVIDVTTAEQGVGGAPVLGRVTLGRRGTGATGMPQLCHRILSHPTGLLLMVGPSNSRRERHELGGELASWLSRVRRVVYTRSREGVDHYGSASLAAASTSEDELIVLEDASPVEVATRPERSLTLLVVHEGISAASLREEAQQYLDGGSAAALLLRRESWWAWLRNLPASKRARREAGRTYPGRRAPFNDDDREGERTPTPPSG